MFALPLQMKNAHWTRQCLTQHSTGVSTFTSIGTNAWPLPERCILRCPRLPGKMMNNIEQYLKMYEKWQNMSKYVQVPSDAKHSSTIGWKPSSPDPPKAMTQCWPLQWHRSQHPHRSKSPSPTWARQCWKLARSQTRAWMVWGCSNVCRTVLSKPEASFCTSSALAIRVASGMSSGCRISSCNLSHWLFQGEPSFLHVIFDCVLPGSVVSAHQLDNYGHKQSNKIPLLAWFGSLFFQTGKESWASTSAISTSKQ